MRHHPDSPATHWGDLASYWYAAARSDELPAKRPRPGVVLGIRIALWRDRAGTAHAFFDRCLHRNALLSEGTIIDDCLACPYHGWTYDRAGRVAHVPSLGPSQSPPDLGLRTYPVREQDGLIWVWLGPGTPDKDPHRMPHWAEPGWGAYYMSTRFDNGVTNLVENFMDVPHTVFVHRGWFRSQSRTKVPITIERTAASVLVTYEQPGDSIGFSDLLMNPKKLPLTHTDKFYLPGHTRVDYLWGAPDAPERAFVITSTCTPICALETQVYTLISYKLGVFNAPARLWLPYYTRRVIEQDVVIMANQGRSLRHHGAPEFHGTSADLIHEHIEALRAWAADSTRQRPEPRIDHTVIWI